MTHQLPLFTPERPVNPRRPAPELPDDQQPPTPDAEGIVTCPACGERFEDAGDVGWHCPSRAFRCVLCKPARGPLTAPASATPSTKSPERGSPDAPTR